MADRVMSLKRSTGTSFGNEIPIGTTADYVDVATSSGTKTLQSVLGSNIGGGHN